MIKSRKKRAIIAAIAVTVLLMPGIICGAICLLNYYEKPVEETEFLPKPDAITVYYTDSEGTEKQKELSEQELEAVYHAFLELKNHYEGVKKYHLPMNVPTRQYIESFPTTRAQDGAVEFHYEQRRQFNLALSDPQESDLPMIDENKIFSFSQTCDSVAISCMYESCLRVYGCKNGRYYGTIDKDLRFSKEAADTFWAVVAPYID